MAEPEHAAETTVAALAERIESDREPMHRFNDSALSPHPRLCFVRKLLPTEIVPLGHWSSSFRRGRSLTGDAGDALHFS